MTQKRDAGRSKSNIFNSLTSTSLLSVTLNWRESQGQDALTCFLLVALGHQHYSTTHLKAPTLTFIFTTQYLTFPPFFLPLVINSASMHSTETFRSTPAELYLGMVQLSPSPPKVCITLTLCSHYPLGDWRHRETRVVGEHTGHCCEREWVASFGDGDVALKHVPGCCD